MKKSEKIEIRISYDEKEKLARLAESEGRSVSELVRDLAKKYAQLNMPRPRPRMSRLHMLGLLLCGLGLGTGATFSYFNVQSPSIQTTYMVHGTIGDHGFGFPLEHANGKINTVTLGDGDGAYSIHIAIKPDAKKKKIAAVYICRQTPEACEDSAQADMKLSGGISPSVWQDKLEDKNLFLVVQPVSIS